ncbi:TonB-linked outer membrane protein, SusC/RagA family [Chitinophaga terrae (ex Kim and Jung 2007)]|uniref:TonB-linked outer membrane protein, SusC/RagA family n=2 Tax=Chitinophaga terrae (ex Kim and Jung 2007) TaxID=408074 RepID=A0A1H4AX76_9BACT|nr:TonB-linked outer membrane protein, SusC/RagA family [Chitinophaga terrae (ex Kim and Jung 2007)]
MYFFYSGKRRRKLPFSLRLFFRAMKLTIVLLMLAMGVNASGYSQTVTVSGKSIPLEKILLLIEQQTGYSFFYNNVDIGKAQPVDLSLDHVSLETALKQVLKEQPLKYTILGRTIFIRPSAGTAPAATVADNNIKVQGTVVDAANGQPLIGVTVQVKGGTAGTTTDANGRFSLTAPDDAILVVSYIGFGKQEIKVTAAPMRIALIATNTGLNQVVVVGYGTEKKKDLTGAIASIKAEDLTRTASTSFTAAIQGKVPGVFISQTNGAPGSASSVRIRGIGTTGGNQPLYVVDGFPLNGSSMSIPGSSSKVDGMSIINPNDIASVEVLKDAAAAAIYGSRAANGVILVTTKRGKEGLVDINLNAYTGFSQLWKKPAFMNATEFARMANELYTNSGMAPNPQWANPESFGKGTDMIDEIFRNAPIQNYDLSFAGGNEKMKTRMSLGYTDQKGTMIGTSYKRYTARITTDLKASKWLSFGGSLAFAGTHSQGQNTDAMQGGIFNLAQQFFPTLSKDSAFFGPGGYYTKDGDNPVLKVASIDNQLKNYRIYGNVFGELEIVKGLKFRTSIGLDMNSNRISSWEGKVVRGFYIHPQATLSERQDQGITQLIENTLSYSRSFGQHNISAVIGQTAQSNKNDWISAGGNGYQNENLRVINGSDVSLRTASGTGTYATLASYLGRVNYSYKSKYLLSASIRRDGSSNFGPNNKWGNFPAVSAGWRISEEQFMKPLSNVLSDLKIRGSWGQLGNDAIPAFGYLSTIRSGGNSDNYVFGTGAQSIAIGATMTRPGNPDLKWETTEQTDIGLDASLLDDRLYLTADYFIKKTRDMLISLPVSLEAGFQNAPTVNGGSVKNSGFELLLGYRDQVGALNFDVSANIATLKNVVTTLGVGQPIVGPNLPGTSMTMTYTQAGKPIGYYRGYIVDGVYQTDAEVDKAFQPNAVAGDFRYRDINGDKLLTDADKVQIGKPWPDLTYGLNMNLSWKGFDLNLMFQGVAGSDIYNANKVSNYPMKYFNGNGIVNGVKDVLNHWTPGSGINDQPGLKYIDANGNYVNASSFFVEKGDYLRLRNLVIGYALPADFVHKNTGSALKSVRVYVSAQNLFTITGYSGFDPEIGSADPLNSGIDTGVFPQPRTFMAGINIGF